MSAKEYTYDIDKYTIGVDENGEDEIGMTVAKVENGEIYFLGNCYGENARCIDLLIQENQELKKQLQIKHDGFMASTDELCEYAVENDRLKNQQKEFIKYLEDEIEACNLTQNLIFNKIKETKIYKEILQKYKEIIGD